MDKVTIRIDDACSFAAIDGAVAKELGWHPGDWFGRNSPDGVQLHYMGWKFIYPGRPFYAISFDRALLETYMQQALASES
jgi:hypothetical protein